MNVLPRIVRSLFLTALFVAVLIQTLAAQPSLSLDLTAHIDSIIAGMPSGNGNDQYQSPGSTQRADWRTMMDMLLADDLINAGTKADALGYRLIRYTDTGTNPMRDYLVVEKTPAGVNYWGTYVFALAPRRPRVVIQSPHGLYDSKTGAEGWYVFTTAGARAFFLNGTHRCNSSVFSVCSGTTTACSDSSAPYRLSDQAHTVDGMFQITTAAMLAAVDSSVFLQPHGFAKLSSDPDIIMSNGTQKTPPAGQDHLLRIRDNLLLVDPTLTFKVAHIDLTWTRLIATTNTQGRLINGSSNPCTNSASSASGRFLHLEQKYSGLRDTKQNWGKLAQAVVLTFPETPTGVAPETPSRFALQQNFPNPFNPATVIRYAVGSDIRRLDDGGENAGSGWVRLAVYDLLGQEVALLVNERKSPGTYQIPWNATGLPTGVYVCRMTAGESVASVKMLLMK